MNYRNCSLFTQTWVSYSRKREKCVKKEKIKIDMQVMMVVFLDTFFRGLDIFMNYYLLLLCIVKLKFQVKVQELDLSKP